MERRLLLGSFLIYLIVVLNIISKGFIMKYVCVFFIGVMVSLVAVSDTAYSAAMANAFQNVGNQIAADFRNQQLVNRLSAIEVALQEQDDTAGCPRLQRLRLVTQIKILKQVLSYYEENRLVEGHALLRKSFLTDAQLKHYRQQLCSISPQLSKTNINGTRFLSGIGAVLLSIGMVKDADACIDSLWRQNVEGFGGVGVGVLGVALFFSSFAETCWGNTIPQELLNEVRDYLHELEMLLTDE